MKRFRRASPPLVGVVLALSLSGCGGSADGSDESLSAEAQRGREIANSNGCAGCHGSNGEGGVGPSWEGLYGSEVELADGTTVVADEDYLIRAIREPSADIVKGSTLQMPSNGLSDDEIAAVIAYIRELGEPANVTGTAGAVERTTLSGVVREPAPQVDAATIPSLSSPGDAIAFRASPGGLQVVYFGFTNCPDVCPTTMADLTVALRRLDPGEADRIDTVMVTIDPARDLETLPAYVRSFVPDATAGGTTDEAALRAVTEPFGVVHEVTTNDEGEIEVSHSGFLYVVDDQGRLVLSWPFGTTSDDMAADLRILLGDRG